MPMSRTLPRVRELKPLVVVVELATTGRTLPRVRELKRVIDELQGNLTPVAPFPGCVN